MNIFSIAVLALLLTGCGSSNYDNWLESPDYLPKKIALDGNKDDCSVIFIGDSRIEGGPFDDQDSGWCNYGIGGDVTWGVENRLSAVIDKQPDTVVIQVGRNDLTVASRDVWTTFLIYRNIIDILVDRGIKVMVTSTLPDSEPSVVTNTMIHELNRLLAEYCEGNAAVFVDLSFALAPDGYLIHTDDGVHSNSVGYVIFIDVVRLRI